MINILSIYVQGRISGVGRKSRTLLYRCSTSKEFVICAIISVVLLYCLLVVGRLARQGPLRQQLKVNKCSQERCTLGELSVISDSRRTYGWTDGGLLYKRVFNSRGLSFAAFSHWLNTTCIRMYTGIIYFNFWAYDIHNIKHHVTF